MKFPVSIIACVWLLGVSAATAEAETPVWRQSLEAEVLGRKPAERAKILEFAEALAGPDGYSAFMHNRDPELHKACILCPTLRELARPYAEAFTMQEFDELTTERDWGIIAQWEQAEKKSFRQQYGLAANSRERLHILFVARKLSGPNWKEARNSLTESEGRLIQQWPLLLYFYQRYSDSTPEQVAAHQAILKKKREAREAEQQRAKAERAEITKKKAEEAERRKKETAAYNKLTLAKNYAKNGMMELAIKTATKIREEFRGSNIASEAEKLLKEWEGTGR